MSQYFKSIQERSAKDGDEGFTLIELLIVIVVLGILAAVVVFALGSVTGNAKASACNADAKTIVTAVQAYNAQHAPTTIGYETSNSSTAQAQSLVSGGYLNSWPTSTNGYTLRLASGPASTTVTGLDANTVANGGENAAAGDVIVITTSPAGTTDYNAQTSTTGCNAL